MSNREFTDPEHVLNTLADVRAFLKMNPDFGLEIYSGDGLWWRAAVFRGEHAVASTEHNDLVEAVRAAVAKAMRVASRRRGAAEIDVLDPSGEAPLIGSPCVHCDEPFGDRAVADGDGRLWHPKCAAKRLGAIENDARPFAEVANKPRSK